MSDPQPTEPVVRATSSGMFNVQKPPQVGGMPIAAWAIAGGLVLLVLAALLFVGRGKSVGPGNTVLPLAAYAANLALAQPAMSESENISGGKYTYIDGRIKNTGSQTVTGVTVQVLFANDVALPPQVETQSMALIRTHEPYVDTQMISATPLKPGDDREFRLTFEIVPSNWNGQMPEIRITSVSQR